MKKIISFVLSTVMTLTVALSASAYADKEWTLVKKAETGDSSKKSYTYYEDFKSAKVGQKPSGLSAISETANTKLYVTKGETEDGEKKNMLLLEDKNESGNIYFEIPVGQKGDKLLFETKVKFENSNGGEPPSFAIDMYGPSATMNRVLQNSNNIKYIYTYSLNGVNQYPIATPLENGVWYEIQLLIDKTTGTYDVQFKTDAFKDKTMKVAGKYDKTLGVTLNKGLPLNPAQYRSGVVKARFSLTARVGEMYVDYIRFKDNAATLEYKGPPVEKLPLPYIGNSVILPDTEVINVVYKNKPVLFTIKPFYEDGTVYAPLRSIGSAYGFTNTFADGVYTLTKGDKVVKVSATEITVDGVKLNAPVKVVSGIYCISIPEFATAMGDKVTFDKDVTIE
jgi:hypothetical protein